MFALTYSYGRNARPISLSIEVLSTWIRNKSFLSANNKSWSVAGDCAHCARCTHGWRVANFSLQFYCAPGSIHGHFAVDILDEDGNNLSVLLLPLLTEIYLAFIRIVTPCSADPLKLVWIKKKHFSYLFKSRLIDDFFVAPWEYLA